MHLELSKPEFSQSIDEQVKAGRFHSPEEVLEEALSLRPYLRRKSFPYRTSFCNLRQK